MIAVCPNIQCIFHCINVIIRFDGWTYSSVVAKIESDLVDTTSLSIRLGFLLYTSICIFFFYCGYFPQLEYSRTLVRVLFVTAQILTMHHPYYILYTQARRQAGASRGNCPGKEHRCPGFALAQRSSSIIIFLLCLLISDCVSTQSDI